MGSASSVYVAYKLLEAYKITDDSSYLLASMAFSTFALALVSEGLGLSSTTPVPPCVNCPWRLFPSLAAHRFIVPSYSLYLIAYTLYFASSLTSKKGSALYSMILIMLAEQNIIIMTLLLISLLFAFDNKNKRFALFYGALVGSHALDAAVLTLSKPYLLYLAYGIRSLAPVALVCGARCWR